MENTRTVKYHLFWSFLVGVLILFSFTHVYSYENADTQASLFSIHAIEFVSGPAAPISIAEFIFQNFSKIGIDVELDFLGGNQYWPRVTNSEVGMYSEGGYDICMIAMSLGNPSSHPGNSLMQIFGSGAIPPAGFNVVYWSTETGKEYNNYRAQESDDLIADIIANLDVPSAIGDLYEWQKIWYDVMPNTIAYNRYEVHAISSSLYGYDPVKYPLASIEDQWFTDDEDTVTVVVSSDPSSFNPLQTFLKDNLYSAEVPMDGLVGNAPSAETVLPTGTDRDTWMSHKYGTTDYLALYPRMATDLGLYSADGLQYNITIRDDIYWHDGHQFDAWDVAFSFQARLTPRIGASTYSSLLVPFGTDDKAAMSGNYSFVIEDKDTDGFYESISFQFVNTFAPWTTDYLGSLILPEHILGDQENHGFDTSGDFNITKWAVNPASWSTHSTSTGSITDRGGYAGPIGTGPMIFKDFDTNTGIVTLEKFENVMWNDSTWVENNSNSFYNIDKLTDMPSTAILIRASLDAAIAEIKNGGINIIDPRFTMTDILEELQIEETIRPILSPGNSWEGLFMNPKFVQEGIHHFQKKGVRHAISHIIPRVELISEMFNGLALPGYTPIPATSWAAIPEADMLEYKQTLIATDGTTPETDATTAYDEYSISLALDWLESEGYDTQFLRTEPKSSDNPSSNLWIEIAPNIFFGGLILVIISTIILYLRPFAKKR